MSFAGSLSSSQVSQAFKCAQADDPLVLNRFGLVGAKMTEDQYLSDNDQAYYEDAVNVLKLFDFPVSQKPQITLINREYGQDYLAPVERGWVKPHEKIHVAVIDYLHNPKNPASFRASERNKGNLQISPLHERARVWADASNMRGAKMIAVYAYNADHDLLPAAFNHTPYFNLIQLNKGPDDAPPLSSILIHRDYARNLMEQGRLHDRLVPHVEYYFQTGKDHGAQFDVG
jgi:hypothetical protein